MPIGYILIVLAQPFNLFFLTLLVFPVKKRIYSLYVYILHLFTVIQFEIVGCNTTGWLYTFYTVLAGILEFTVPYIIAKYYLRSLRWKSTFMYFIFGGITNSVLGIIVTHFNYGRDYFSAYLRYDLNGVSALYGLFYLAIAIFFNVIMALIYRRFIIKENILFEKFYRIITLFFMTVVVLSGIFFKYDAASMDNNIQWYYSYFMPTFIVILICIMAIFFVQQEKKRIKKTYSNIMYENKAERGDSNKKVCIFNEGSKINVYLNSIVKELKKKGFAIEIISYMSERISVPDEDIIIKELSDVIAYVEESKAKEYSYIVINFKKINGGLVIHMEYNKRMALRHIYRLLKREYISVLDKYYRYEKTGTVTDEIMLLYPDNSVKK